MGWRAIVGTQLTLTERSRSTIEISLGSHADSVPSGLDLVGSLPRLGALWYSSGFPDEPLTKRSMRHAHLALARLASSPYHGYWLEAALPSRVAVGDEIVR